VPPITATARRTSWKQLSESTWPDASHQSRPWNPRKDGRTENQTERMQSRCCHRSCQTRSTRQSVSSRRPPPEDRSPQSSSDASRVPRTSRPGPPNRNPQAPAARIEEIPRLETSESGRGDRRTPPKQRPADTMPFDESLSPRGVPPRQIASIVEPKPLDVRHPRWQMRLHHEHPHASQRRVAERAT
jgi:hypothetical protein